MKKTKETIGDRLESTRKKQGLTQSEFCEKLGIGRTSYSYYLRGEREIPVSVLVALFEKFSVEPFWVIYGENSKHNMRQKSEIVNEIKNIGIAVDSHLLDRIMEVSVIQKWDAISDMYEIVSENEKELDLDSNGVKIMIDRFFQSEKKDQKS